MMYVVKEGNQPFLTSVKPCRENGKWVFLGDFIPLPLGTFSDLSEEDDPKEVVVFGAIEFKKITRKLLSLLSTINDLRSRMNKLNFPLEKWIEDNLFSFL